MPVVCPVCPCRLCCRRASLHLIVPQLPQACPGSRMSKLSAYSPWPLLCGVLA